MPPNRQSSAAVLRSLSANDLAGFVSRSAYAPLTEALAAAEGPGKHHEEGKQQQQQQQQQQQAAADGDSWHEHEHEHDLAGAAHGIDSDAYWGWPSLSSAPLDEAAAAAQVVHDDAGEEWDAELARRRALLASILAEEEARRAVSADFIVAKLVYDASQKRSARNEASAVETNSAEAIASSGRAQEDQEDQEEHKDEAYWHWEAETNTFSGDVDVDAGAGDARSSCLGVARIEELLKKEAVRIKLHSHSAAAVVVGSVRDDYWDWDALAPKQLRERLVSQIMADERARLLLTASHMEGTLKKARASTGPVVRSEEESREDYWAWDQERHMVHDPRTQDPTHPSKCYWDWSPPLSAEVAKSAVIRQIVEDEAARRAVSVEHVEEVLKDEASSNTESRNSRLEKREQVFVADNEQKVMEEGYWDM